MSMGKWWNETGRGKVKESRNRPGVAQRVPWGLGFQISWYSAQEGSEVVSLMHRSPLPPGMFLVLIFARGWVNPGDMERSEGDMSMKNPVTPPGKDPGTVRLVAQLLNRYVPHTGRGKWKYLYKQFSQFQFYWSLYSSAVTCCYKGADKSVAQPASHIFCLMVRIFLFMLVSLYIYK
jgi:hypothetical protein